MVDHKIFKVFYLFSCAGAKLQHVGSFSCGMQTPSYRTWNLVSWSGIEPGPRALGVGVLLLDLQESPVLDDESHTTGHTSLKVVFSASAPQKLHTV